MQIIQERVVVGTLRQPRVYEMADGNLLEVVWDGADRMLLPEGPIADATRSDLRWKSRHWVGRAA